MNQDKVITEKLRGIIDSSTATTTAKRKAVANLIKHKDLRYKILFERTIKLRLSQLQEDLNTSLWIHLWRKRVIETLELEFEMDVFLEKDDNFPAL